MERHDTHILSDSQEEDEKGENSHCYVFNNSSNSDSNSLKNTVNTNTKRGSKFKLSDVFQINNNEENEILNGSIISIQDLDDVFYNEKRFKKEINNKKDEKKEIKDKTKTEIKISIQENNKENIVKEYKNKSQINNIPDNVRIKMIKLNYDDNISVFNKYLTYTPYLINKLKIKKIKKKRLSVSFEKNKEKAKEKLKQDKKEEKGKKNNTNINDNNNIIKKKKIPQSDTNSERTSNSNSNNEQKKIKNLYDILKSNNMKLLKINHDSFTIIKEKNLGDLNLYESKTKNFKKRVKSSNSFGFQLSNIIQKQNDFYLHQDYEYNSYKKNYFSPAKIQINGKKRFEILQAKKSNYNKLNQEYNSKIIITNSNNSQYSLRYHNNSSGINKYFQNKYNNEFNQEYNNENNNDCMNDFSNNDNINRNYIDNFNNYNRLNEDYISCIERMNRMNKYNPSTKNMKQNTCLRLKNDKKIKILYDLYCKRPTKENKSISRINSAFSIKNRRNGSNIYQNSNNLIDLNDNFDKDFLIRNKLYNSSNNKNWLLRLLKVQKDKNIYHYEKHFGNNENCPLCQQMDKKNEEQIRKIGIYHMASDQKKSESRSNSKKRRINSALPSTYSKYINYNHSKEIEGNNESKNILHYNKSSAAFNEYNLSRKLFNKNQLKRKLKFNKQRYMNSNFS